MGIYLIDADPQIRRLLSGLAEDVVHAACSEFDSPEAARLTLEEAVRQGGTLPELVITEVHHDDGHDGLAFCQWLKNTPALADIPLLAMVKDPDYSVLQEAFSLGAYDVVRKLDSPGELMIRVSAALRFSAAVKAKKEAVIRLERELTFNQAVVTSLSNMGEGLFVIEQRRFTYVNPALCTLTGFSAEEFYRWDDFLQLFHPSEQERIMENHRRRLAGESFMTRYNTALLDKHGAKIDVEFAVAMFVTPSHNGVACLVRDIREQLALQNRLQDMAHYDQLTGLPNRRLLQDRLEQALHRATRAATPLALLFIDLDGFKSVNDTLGHGAGDELLVQVAHRLRGDLRSSDTAARLAGDEFVLILEADILGDLDPINVAEKLLIKLRRPYHLLAGVARISASIGVVVSNGAPDTADSVLHDADIGMYTAKQQGKDGYFVVPRAPTPDFHI